MSDDTSTTSATSSVGEIVMMEGTSTVSIDQPQGIKSEAKPEQPTLFPGLPTATGSSDPTSPGTQEPPALAALAPALPEPAQPAEHEREKSSDKNTGEAKTKVNDMLDKLADQHARLESMISANYNRERLLYLREIGAKAMLADQDLLSLSPSVDVNTAEGRTSIDTWRQQRPEYFDHRDPGMTLDVETLAKGIPSSKMGTFGPHNYKHIMANMQKGK